MRDARTQNSRSRRRARSRADGLRLAALLAIGVCGAGTAADLPPEFQIVPLANACATQRHPTLPVLYVSCEDAPESKNLVTFALASDGSIDAGSKQVCPDYFSPDAKSAVFRHKLYRPAINAQKRVLYLAAYPVLFNSSTTYADTNLFEFVAVALDEAGQPGKRLLPFRTVSTGTQGLCDGIRYEPTLDKIYVTYYSTIDVLDLDSTGLPVVGSGRYLASLIEHQQWSFVPEWNRYFAMRTTSMLINFVWNARAPDMEFAQSMQVTASGPRPGRLPLSYPLRKLYLLDSAAAHRLVVVPLNERGSFLGLPRRFDIGPSTRLAFDFRRRRLYAFGEQQLRVYEIDAEGYPRATPRTFPLVVGEIRDVQLDERSGRLYIACSAPPTP